jgi:hypothetical protein
MKQDRGHDTYFQTIVYDNIYNVPYFFYTRSPFPFIISLSTKTVFVVLKLVEENLCELPLTISENVDIHDLKISLLNWSLNFLPVMQYRKKLIQ